MHKQDDRVYIKEQGIFRKRIMVTKLTISKHIEVVKL